MNNTNGQPLPQAPSESFNTSAETIQEAYLRGRRDAGRDRRREACRVLKAATTLIGAALRISKKTAEVVTATLDAQADECLTRADGGGLRPVTIPNSGELRAPRRRAYGAGLVEESCRHGRAGLPDEAPLLSVPARFLPECLAVENDVEKEGGLFGGAVEKGGADFAPPPEKPEVRPTASHRARSVYLPPSPRPIPSIELDSSTKKESIYSSKQTTGSSRTGGTPPEENTRKTPFHEFKTQNPKTAAARENDTFDVTRQSQTQGKTPFRPRRVHARLNAFDPDDDSTLHQMVCRNYARHGKDLVPDEGMPVHMRVELLIMLDDLRYRRRGSGPPGDVERKIWQDLDALIGSRAPGRPIETMGFYLTVANDKLLGYKWGWTKQARYSGYYAEMNAEKRLDIAVAVRQRAGASAGRNGVSAAGQRAG